MIVITILIKTAIIIAIVKLIEILSSVIRIS